MAKLQKTIKQFKNRFISKADHLKQKYSQGKEERHLNNANQQLNMSPRYNRQYHDNFENLKFKNQILPSNHSEKDKNIFFYNAIIHGLSQRVGDEDQLEDQEKLQKILEKKDTSLRIQDLPEYCACCSAQVQKEQIPLYSSDTLDLDFLGPGIPLYFGFLKYTALFLCIIILSVGSYNFFSNAFLNGCTGQDDEQNGCNRNFISMFSLPNKRFDEKFNFLQEILDVFSIGALIIMLQYFRKSQNRIKFQADNLELTESDYAIKIHGLPKYDKAFTKYQTYQELRRVFEPYLDGMQFSISQINFCYDLDKLNKLSEQLTKLNNEYQKALKEYYEQNNVPNTEKKMPNEEQYLRNINLKEQEIHSLQNTYLLNQQNPQNEDQQVTKQFTGVCFVVFQKEQQKVKILQEKKHIIKEMFKNEQVKITIEEGPDPSDVIWENQGVRGTKEQVIGYVKSLTIEFIVYLIGFLIVWYCSQFVLKWQIEQDPSLSNICNEISPEAERLGRQHGEIKLQTQNTENFISHDHSDDNTFLTEKNQNQDYAGHKDYVSDARVTYMTYFISYLLIPAFNTIGRLTMSKTTQFEGHETNTRMQIAKSRKLALGMFFVMGLQSLLIKVVLKWWMGCLQAAQQEIFQDGGLLYTQLNLFISIAFVYPLVYLIDVKYIAKLLKRYWYAGRDRNKCTLTQMETNELYQYPEYDIAQKYGYVINIMFLAALYSPLIPVCLLISLLGVLFFYWIEKYAILRKKSFSRRIGYSISRQMTELLEWFLPLYCLADMFFQYLVVTTAHRQPDYTTNPLVDMFVKSSVTSQIGVIAGILNLMLPMEKINRIIFTNPPELENKYHYEEAKLQFTYTYQGLNPVTGHQYKEKQVQRDRQV